MVNRRVVVTGLGLVTPLGTGVEKTWRNICAGKSGVDTIRRFDATDYPVQIAAEVRDFNVAEFFEPKQAKRLACWRYYRLWYGRLADHL